MALPSPLRWAPPVRADTTPPFAYPTAIEGVSCPSASLCVAVDGSGDVLTSIEPTGGAAAWTSATIDADSGLTAVSCPSTALCVAVDGSGDVLTSTDPTGGSGAWSEVKVDAMTRIASVSCASASLCVAGDSDGNAILSTNPTGGVGAWSVVHIDGTHSNLIWGVSCPSVGLCVAVGEEGELITSTDPNGGAGAWTTSDVDSSNTITSVSCPSEGLCAAVDDSGNVLTSTEPTGGAGAWSGTKVEGSGGGRISCPIAAFCAVTGSGAVLTSTDPTGGEGAWTSTPINLPHTSIDDVSCVEESLCILSDSESGIVTSTNPTGGEGAWTSTMLEVGANSPQAISCVSVHLCVAVDDAGNVLTSIDPDGAAGSWSSAHIDGHWLTGVSCPSAELCVAVDEAGNVVTSTEPTGGAAAWITTDIDGAIPLRGVSCASVALCVAIDREGDVVTSTEPTAGAGAWTVAHVADEDEDLGSVSCPSETLCVATDGGERSNPDGPGGYVVVSTDPAGGAATWKETYVGAGRSISCLAAGLCVTVRLDDTLLTSTEPTAGVDAWAALSVTGRHLNGLDELACATGGLCVTTTYGGNGSPGNVLTTTDPTGGGSAWVVENIYGLPVRPLAPFELYVTDLTGVSCVPEGMCVVTDSRGRAIVGTPTPPVAPANIHPPAISGTPSVGHALSCSAGSWSGEPAPGFAYQWLRDGVPIASATAGTYTVQGVDEGHGLACQVTATNSAGSEHATSEALQVPKGEGTPLPIANDFQIIATRGHKNGRILVALNTSGPGTFSATAIAAVLESSDGENRKDKRSAYGTGSATASAAGTTKLTIKPRKDALSALMKSGKLGVRISITFTPRDGTATTKEKTVVVHHPTTRHHRRKTRRSRKSLRGIGTLRPISPPAR